MRTIWKFAIFPKAFTLPLPVGATFLDVQTQADGPVMWFEIPRDEADLEARHFQVFGTGHEIAADFNGKYLGTFQLNMGMLIFHCTS